MLYLRRLDRYLMGQFLLVLAIALAALSAITILVHLMDHIDVYLDAEAAWSDVGRYYLYQLPYNLLITLPMAMLIATILTIGEMGRHGELTAMKASGLSLYRISSPVLFFSLVMSFGALLLNETVVPRLNEQANDVYDGPILGREVEFENFRGSFVYQNSEGYTYIVRSLFVQDSASSGEQVEVQRAFADGTFLRINAPRMIWEPSSRTWVLTDGELRLFPGPGPEEEGSDAPGPAAGGGAGSRAAGDTVPAAAAGAAGTPPDTAAAPRRDVEERMYAFQILRSPHLDDTPQELLAREKDPEEMGFRDLEVYIADRERLGAETRKERVDLHMKLAYPFANAIIVLFGVALVGSAVHAGRQSATAGFGLALFLTIIFWGFLRVGQGVGYGGGLSPVAAAWLANGVFLIVGLALLTRART